MQKQFKTYQELKAEKQLEYNKIFSESGVFYAFSNDQFKEGIEKIKQSGKFNNGDKLTNIGMGGYIPSKFLKSFSKEISKLEKDFKKEIKKQKELKNQAILYELKNYEAFYSGDITDTFLALKPLGITEKEILSVYKANYHYDFN